MGNLEDSGESHFYTPRPYQVILILGSLMVSFVTKVGVDPGECGGF